MSEKEIADFAEKIGLNEHHTAMAKRFSLSIKDMEEMAYDEHCDKMTKAMSY